MSKYNVGDKFTIEIKELINGSNDKMLYKSDCYSIIFGEEQLDKLQKYNGSTISEDTLEMERMKVLNDGRNEVWELAKKLWHNDARTNDDIYGIEYFIDIANEYTPQEALAKLEAYEKEQEKVRQKIMVGDIVTLEDGIKGVVMDEDGVDNVAIFTENGCIEAWMNKKYITKTGKHIDIQSLLEQIKE